MAFKKIRLNTALFLLAAFGLIGSVVQKTSHDSAPLPATLTCNLPADSTVIIGCTDNCGYFVTSALKRSAERLSYNLEIIPNLRTESSATLHDLDGLIIPGGADIDPKFYRRGLPGSLRQHIQSLDHLVVYSEEGKQRDSYEYKLLHRYFADDTLDDLPVMGICRGMQMLSASQDIPLYVDINTELGMNTPKYHLDRITTGPESGTLQQLIPGDSFFASQIHHQAMHYEYFQDNRSSYPHLRVTATSHQGRIAEVLEFTERPVIGTQFHPEYSLGVINGRIFDWLLGSACRKKRNAARRASLEPIESG